jgi:hypothetical protein
MSIGPLINLADGYIQSLFSTPSSGTSQAGTASTGTSTSGGTQDTNQLSPFAQVLSSLQQLQQSNPTQYQQVTQQISANLQTAAQTATANGNTSLANELNKLSADFSSASTSGQLPNVQDLAQAIGGGGHHHFHHGGGASITSTPSSTGSSGGTATTGNGLSQLIQSLSPSQTGPTANNSLNPLSIIDSTLSSAGVQVS